MKKTVLLILLGSCFFGCRKKEIIRSASLTTAYMEANRGKTIVEIPIVYEISNIIIALEDEGMGNSTFVDEKSAYFQEIIDYFTPYKNHPLLEKLDLSSNNGLSQDYFNDHYSFRTNSFSYQLDGETLKDKQLYGTLWKNDKFTEHLEQIQDFVLVSKMLDFIEAHAEFYQKEVEQYKMVVPIQREWDWLESKFPQRVDTYRVVFSPLTTASHNTDKITDDSGQGYIEILMFISGLGANLEDLTPVRKAYRERVVFTEIDHNYVNPESDKNLETIKDAMKNLKDWYPGQSYEGAYSIFNEYMTWAVFTLYLKEFYAEADFLEAKGAIENQMERSRSFLRFSAFNDKLLELYEADPSNIPALYPGILQWVKSVDR